MHEGTVAWSRVSVLAVSCVVAGLALVSLASQRHVRLLDHSPSRSPVTGGNAESPAPPVAPAARTQARELREGRAIDVNLATADELRLLPGIGPTLAQRIVESRAKDGAFRSVTQLTRVHGIGPKTVQRVAGLLVVATQRGKSQPAETVTAR